MTLYTDAVTAVRDHAEQTQATLDAQLAQATGALLAAVRVDLFDGVEADSPIYAVCALVAQAITVGREGDGYPLVQFTDEAAAVVSAASAAGLMPNGTIGSVPFAHGRPDLPYSYEPAQKAQAAWREARDYRKAQEWRSL